MNRLNGTNGANQFTREGHYEGEIVRLRGGDDAFTSSLYGNDIIYGENGNDFLNGRGGDDRISGGQGHDTLVGGENNDRLEGNGGNDSILGGHGTDVLVGHLGNDWLAEYEIDYLSDHIYGGRGDDTLTGATGMDLLVGGHGNDTIHMMGGYAYGDGAPQALNDGAAGRDSIRTDLGFDYGSSRFVTGGGGADNLEVWFSRFDGVPTEVHFLDFNAGEADTIELGLNDMPAAYNRYLAGTMDTNQDWVLDAQDGSSPYGSVTSDAATNTLTLTIGDGDALIVHGVTAIGFDSVF